METLQYEPAMLPELTSAYNDIISGVPHCYPIRIEDFSSSTASLSGGEQADERLHSEAGFVVREAASILGFIHAAIRRPKKADETEKGIVRFFWYEQGRRDAGQRLLEAAEDHLIRRGMDRIDAFPQYYLYPFYYLKPAYLSDRLGHIHALLRFNGYARVAGEVFLDWPDYEPHAPSPAGVSSDISVEWKQGRGTRPGVVVRAHRENKEMGICECLSCGEFSHADNAQDWAFTDWLGVEAEFQGKGLGRYLLQRALRELHGAGYRHAAISTSWRNHRAFLFYSNYGYRVVDWTYGLGREIQ